MNRRNFLSCLGVAPVTLPTLAHALSAPPPATIVVDVQATGLTLSRADFVRELSIREVISQAGHYSTPADVSRLVTAIRGRDAEWRRLGVAA